MSSLEPNAAGPASAPSSDGSTPTPAASSAAATATATTSAPSATSASSGAATAAHAPPLNTEAAASDAEIRALVGEFEAHDFGADNDFRAGLPSVIKAIKGRGSTAAQIDEIIARAQWFYFTRLKQQTTVPFETYLRYRTRETESQPMKSPTVSTREILEVADSASAAQASSSQPTSAATAAEGRVAEVDAVAGEPVATASAASAPATSATAGNANEPPAIDEMKFADVVRLIAEGRADEVPVPTIPDGINDAPPSVSTMKARPKPWEREAPAPTEQTEQTPQAGEQQPATQ